MDRKCTRHEPCVAGAHAEHTACFTPPFCPNPRCDSRTNPAPWRFQRKGFYLRGRPPHRVQRYRCSRCRRSFSSQSFATTYWLKRPDLLEPVFHRLVACSAFRQIAREYQVSTRPSGA
ncbi:MAG: hypothetical protein R3F35_13990 [Myxococcota bacterium]